MHTVKLLYPVLSYKIVGLCFEAHNELGRFARERQYGKVIESKLRGDNIKFKKELQISNSGNVIDFLIEDLIILELKCEPMITKKDYFQVQRYLQAAGIELGILVNFRNKYLRPKRILKLKKKN